MGHPDDYRDEMERLSSHEADAVLAGERPDAAAAGMAAAAAERLRRELLSPPGPEAAERHLAAMRVAADPRHPRRNVMRKRTGKRVATLGLAAVLVLGAGIAGALTLPDEAAEEAKQQVEDVQAPPAGVGENGDINGDTNGDTDGDGVTAADASAHGRAVSEAAHDDSTEGCEKGQTVAGVASSKADGHRQDDPDTPDPCANGEHGTTITTQAQGDGGGSGSGGGGSGGGQGSGGSAHGSGGGSGSGGGGSGGGQGSGGSAHGSGGGQGSGGASSGAGGPPEDLPTPGE